jgi:mannose-6-phosphate isomerase-like protein (cupin superfamily)
MRDGSVGTRTGIVSRPGEGQVYPFEPDSIVRYKVIGEETFGHIECYEREVPPNTIGADPHVHYSNVEVFYVVEGHPTIQIGEPRVSYAPGSVVVAPLTAVNGFANETDKPCKLFIFFTPSRNHHLYFQGMADLKHGDPAHYAAGLAELRQRFDSDTALDARPWIRS